MYGPIKVEGAQLTNVLLERIKDAKGTGGGKIFLEDIKAKSGGKEVILNHVTLEFDR